MATDKWIIHWHTPDSFAELARDAGLAVHLTPIDKPEDDVTAPTLPTGSFDVVLSRHVLWSMPDPQAALQSWNRLLRAGGAGGGLTVLVARLSGTLSPHPASTASEPQ